MYSLMNFSLFDCFDLFNMYKHTFLQCTIWLPKSRSSLEVDLSMFVTQLKYVPLKLLDNFIIPLPERNAVCIIDIQQIMGCLEVTPNAAAVI